MTPDVHNFSSPLVPVVYTSYATGLANIGVIPPTSSEIDLTHGNDDQTGQGSEVPPPPPPLPPTITGTKPISKFRYVEQRGNMFHPWPFADRKIVLETPIYNATRTIVLYNCTRVKKNNRDCVLRSSLDPTLEVNIVYRSLLRQIPIISFMQEDPIEPKGKIVEIQLRRNRACGKNWLFDVPALWGVIGGLCEWSYVSRNEIKSQLGRKAVSSTGTIKEGYTPAQQPASKLGKELEGLRAKRGKAKLSGACCGASSRMALHYYFPPLQSRADETAVGEEKERLHNDFPVTSSPQAIKLAEFVRSDDDGNVITSGLMGPAGQGGWLEIFNEEKIPEWLIIATCLVMLKKERDRRTRGATRVLY